MSIFQIFAILFGLFMLYIVSIHTKRKTFSTAESLIWISLWCLFIVLSAFPQLLQGVSNTLHFSRVFDLLIVSTFVIIVYLTFNNYVSNKRLQKKLEDVVRKMAIKNASSNK